VSLPSVRAAWREVVPAERVEATIESLHLELDSLEDELVRAEHEAAEAERRREDRGAAPAVTAQAVSHVQAFLRELEATSDRSFEAAREWARATAQQRTARARAEAETILANSQAPSRLLRAAGPEALGGSGAGATALTLVPEAGTALEAPRESLGAIAFAPTSLPAVSSLDVDADVFAERPRAEDHRFEPAAATLFEPDAVRSLDAAAVPIDGVNEEFWREQHEASRARTLSARPLEAVLPMIALVIVLVVVLAWIG